MLRDLQSEHQDARVWHLILRGTMWTCAEDGTARPRLNEGVKWVFQARSNRRGRSENARHTKPASELRASACLA